MVFVCIYGEITRFIETFVGYLRPQEVLKGREPLLAENGYTALIFVGVEDAQFILLAVPRVTSRVV